MEPISVFLALDFDESNGKSERGQAPDEQDQEVSIGGVLIKRNTADGNPDGNKPNGEHHDLREFHQKQVVLIELLVGSNHGDVALFWACPFHHAGR